jgi:glycosyltransferase involved in cell wall biosynthesis
MVHQLKKEGSTHIQWPVGRKTPICLLYLFPLRRFLITSQVDILHLRSRLPAWIGYLAWKSLPKNRRPVLITTFHGFYSVNRYSAIMTRGQKIIAISHAVKRHIHSRYGISEDRIDVIYRGVDPTVFDPKTVTRMRIDFLRQQWKLTHIKSPLIMLPGRMTRLKGQDVFLKSLSYVRDLDWHGICVGDMTENPRYVSELKALSRSLDIDKRIHFVDYEEDMAAALMLSDVVVSATSKKPEAFGRISVEAQAMGKPVIASAHGGSMETVLPGKTGWLVQPEDPGSMASAIRQALSDSLMRTSYGTNGQKWVRKCFSVERMCRKTVELYNRLLHC